MARAKAAIDHASSRVKARQHAFEMPLISTNNKVDPRFGRIGPNQPIRNTQRTRRTINQVRVSLQILRPIRRYAQRGSLQRGRARKDFVSALDLPVISGQRNFILRITQRGPDANVPIRRDLGYPLQLVEMSRQFIIELARHVASKHGRHSNAEQDHADRDPHDRSQLQVVVADRSLRRFSLHSISQVRAAS